MDKYNFLVVAVVTDDSVVDNITIYMSSKFGVLWSKKILLKIEEWAKYDHKTMVALCYKYLPESVGHNIDTDVIFAIGV